MWTWGAGAHQPTEPTAAEMRSAQEGWFDAAARGDEQTIVALLEGSGSGSGSKTSIDTRDSDGRTALHHAAAAGHAELVTVLVQRGAKTNTLDDGKWSPLHSAAAAGHALACSALLAAGADQSIEAGAGSSGSTALILAASKGRATVVRTLLGAGASTEAVDGSGASALHRAAGKGHLEIVEALLEGGGSAAATLLDARDREGHTAFHAAAVHEQAAACVLLAEKGAALDTTNLAGEAPKALLTPSLCSHLGLADEDEEMADHTDWLNASFPVQPPPNTSNKAPRVA